MEKILLIATLLWSPTIILAQLTHVSHVYSIGGGSINAGSISMITTAGEMAVSSISDEELCNTIGFLTSDFLNCEVNVAEEVSQTWSIFPNPVFDQLSISAPYSVTSETTVNLYDSTGKIVISQNGSQTKTILISVLDLPPGIYWLIASNPNNTYNAKVIKL
jgi:hypothetical protein